MDNIDAFLCCGPRRLAERIRRLYERQQAREPDVFTDTIKIDDATLLTVVSHLEAINLSETDFDTKGVAFEQFMDGFFKGDFGQYFTPREIIQFAVDMGFLPDVRRILSVLPKKRQNLFFSATMPDDIESLIRRTSRKPVMVEVTRRATPVSSVTQVIHPVQTDRKKELLKAILKNRNMHRILVFTRTKARANQLTKVLDKSGHPATVIHSNKSQNARMKALAHFRDGKFDILIATDIAARGFDVEGISHVVNFEVPDTPEDYIHRIGRTARAGGSGNAISLVAPQEHKKLAAIERLIKKQIKREPVSGFLITTDASKLEQSRKLKQQPTTLSRRKLNRSKDSSFSRNGAKQTLRTGRKQAHRNKRTRSRQEHLFRDPLGRQSGLPD